MDITELARIPIGEDVALRLTLITNDSEEKRLRLATYVPSDDHDLSGPIFPPSILPQLIKALQDALDDLTP